MNINQIRALPDSLVLSGLKSRVLKERENMTEVLEFLREVDRRRLYAESNHPSLWSFCTVELKYSAGAASRECDHIIEVALGGTNDLQNLRLRCRGHNQRSSVKTFGPRPE